MGANPIDVRVTAQDGTTIKTYTMTVTRAALPSANADLAALTTTAGALSPAFGAGTTTYSTPSVPNATSSVTVTATRAQANASLEARVNGGAFTSITSATPSGALALNVGPNIIDVKVTAQDTTTTKTYTINITRSAPPAAPTITSVAPARAPLAGGTTVVITGTDFTGATGVTIGGTAATGVVVDSPTQITATVPLGMSGISDITVTTGLGTGTGSGLFYYYAASGGPVAMAASKVDIFTPNGAGKVLPGAPIQYRTLIANTGGTDATTDELEVDTTVPVVDLNELQTNDPRPILTGTVTDTNNRPTTLAVTISGTGVFYAAVPVQPDGSWATTVKTPACLEVHLPMCWLFHQSSCRPKSGLF